MLTAAQLTILRDRKQEAKVGFTWGSHAYCSGEVPITLDSTLYTPKAMTWERINFAAGIKAQTSVILEDSAGTIRAGWYSSRFSQTAAVLSILLRDLRTRDWTVILEMDWNITRGAYNRAGEFRLHLSGASGLRPKGLLEMANRTDFPFAPEPGEVWPLSSGRTIQWGGGNPTPPPNPGGYTAPFQHTHSPVHLDGDDIVAGILTPGGGGSSGGGGGQQTQPAPLQGE